jgi:hypothetical protein
VGGSPKTSPGLSRLRFYVGWNIYIPGILFIEISRVQIVYGTNLVLITGDGIIKITDFGISKKNGNY